MSGVITQWLLLLSGSVLVGTLLLVLFAARHRVGISHFFVTLGVLQYLQATLSATVYAPLLPNVYVSPGSAVLFTASLSMVLLVHLREGPELARRLLYALVAANVAVGVMSILFGLHLNLPDTLNPLNTPAELFQRNPRGMLVGSAALLIDGVLLVTLYEALSKLRQQPFWRISIALGVVLVVDSVIFVFGAFAGQSGLAQMIASSAFGKLAMTPIFAGLLIAYLKICGTEGVDGLVSDDGQRDYRDVYQFMTYREKYEAARTEMELDALTRAYSRRYFDTRLKHSIEVAEQNNTALSLLMVDVDHFKRLNDTWGHQAGDQVLKIVALSAKDAVRTGDRVCRYGGEEFAVLVIGADAELAVKLAERIRGKVKTALTGELEKIGPLTVSIGVASFPEDARTPERLVAIADGRLYEGKANGRDQVVARANREPA